ncbi:MAG TPA: type II secretion system protein [Tepidisphaeraceae bacterium]|jgi:prepilin-type N-terminal cleavage/methylation domain-containing protein
MPRRSSTARPGSAPGFTLIELLIVIAIIGVLSGILFVGFGAIRRSQDQRNTRAAMEVARTLFNNYVNQARAGGNNVTSDAGTSTDFYLRLRPTTWQFNGDTFNQPPVVINTAPPSPTPADMVYLSSIDFFNVPHRSPKTITVAGPPTTTKPGPVVPMDAPTTAVESSRNIGSADLKWRDFWQLNETMFTIRRLRSSPEAKATWSTLRESQIVHMPPTTADLAKTPPDNRGYDLIIDAWGHPLMFVPGSGLRGVQYGEGAARNGYVSGDPNTQHAVTQAFNAIRAPDGRGFWMSPGPDGFYDTQDDNLYSFDN